MKSTKVCEYSRSGSFHDDLILQDQASGERFQDQWSSGSELILRSCFWTSARLSMFAAFRQRALPLDLLQRTSLYNYRADFLMTIFHLISILCCLLWNVYLHVCLYVLRVSGKIGLANRVTLSK